ncbi:MAG: Maf family protein [Anaerolineales bacterium]
MNSKPVLILASASPRRRELLALGNWMFHPQPVDMDETARPGEAPADYVLRLAESKARLCAEHAHAEQTIVAADTVVVLDGALLGKPADMAQAAEMLRRLRGRSHQVYTGLAVLRMSDGRLMTDLCVTEVPMRAYSDEEMNAYIQSGDPLDKAGAYAIQHPTFRPVAEMRGCYASVMGLPLCHLVRTLRQLNISPNADVPANCQVHLRYQCPIFRQVLRGEQVG